MIPSGSGGNQVLQGHLNWNYTTDDCGQPDISPYASWWGGGVCCYPIPEYDGISYRAMGALPRGGYGRYFYCPVEAAGCAWNTGPGTYKNGWEDITDSDHIYNEALTWYTGPPTNFPSGVDLQSVATHESGHTMGLADLRDPVEEDLTMFFRLAPDTRARTLNWGDYTGMQALYP